MWSPGLFLAFFLTASEPSGHVTLAVEAPAHASVYIALVAEDQPWSAPSQEKVLPAGERRVRWPAPAGRYRVLAGAPGFTVETGPPLELTAGQERTVELTLAPLGSAQGRLVTTEGAPVAGARVGLERAFLVRDPGRFSALAEAHLAPNFATTSRADGTFEVGVPPRFRVAVWVEAPGFAPAYVPDFEAGDTAVAREVRLAPGAGFTLRWASACPAREGWTIHLAPRTAVFPAGLPATGPLALTGRAFGSTALSWWSLPAGGYEVWLWPPEGEVDSLPRSLGGAQLVVGSPSELVLPCPPSQPTAAPTASTSRALRLLVDRSPALGETLEVLGPSLKPKKRLRRVSAGLEVSLANSCRPGDHWAVESPQWVALSPRPVGAEHCSEPLRLTAHPRAEVRGVLAPPTGGTLPEQAELAAERCPAGREEPCVLLGTLPVSIDRTGAWRGPVPAGDLRLRLDVGTFAPLDWDLSGLAPASRRDLGRQALTAGGVVLVRVVSGQDGSALDGVRVDALPVAELDRRLKALEQGQAVRGVRAGVTAEGGWLRLRGLAPARYRLALLAPGRELPHLSEEIEVPPRREQYVGDVEIPAPGSLEVQVVVGARLAAEQAKPAEVLLTRLMPLPRLRLTALPDARGQVEFRELAAGTWRVTATVSLPDGRTLPAGEAELGITDGQDESLELESTWALLRGRVSYRGVPVSGQLSLEPVEITAGAPVVRMTARADAAGRFEIPQAGPGVYLGSFSDDSGSFVRVWLPAVRVPESLAELEVFLPEGVVAGRLATATAEPVVGQRVALTAVSLAGLPSDGRRVSRTTTTDAEGRFQFEAVAAGEWELEVRQGHEAQFRPITLAEGQALADIEWVVGEP